MLLSGYLMIKMYFYLGYFLVDFVWYFILSIKLFDYMINRGFVNRVRVFFLFEYLRIGIVIIVVFCVIMYDCSIFGLFYVNDVFGIVICVFWRSKSVVFFCYKW